MNAFSQDVIISVNSVKNAGSKDSLMVSYLGTSESMTLSQVSSFECLPTRKLRKDSSWCVGIFSKRQFFVSITVLWE